MVLLAAGSADADHNNGHVNHRVDGGYMSCYPANGVASLATAMFGYQTSGDVHLFATGDHATPQAIVNGVPVSAPCTFAIEIDENDVVWIGKQSGVETPGTGSGTFTITNALNSVCAADFRQECTPSIDFHWERDVDAGNGVVTVGLIVPYDLKVNGILVDEGEYTFMDPPLVSFGINI